MSDAFERLAANTSRRGFLSRVGGALVAATAGGTVGKLIEPGEADAYHFCGHIHHWGRVPTRPGSPESTAQAIRCGTATDGRSTTSAG